MYVDSLDEFRSVLGRRLMVTSNYTFADVDGNIRTSGTRGRLAGLTRRLTTARLPGDTSRLLWRGVHRLRDLRRCSIRVAATSECQQSSLVDVAARHIDLAGPALYRAGTLSLCAQVVLEALDTASRLSPDDVRRLKFSSRMRVADLLLPELLDAAASGAFTVRALCSGTEILT